jgi:DNA polymerase III subunit alpha
MKMTKAQALESVKNSKFTNLHHHTHYSALDGVGTVRDHMCSCGNKGLNGMFITDHGVMSGSLEAYRLSKEPGMKALFKTDKRVPGTPGNEIYITPDITVQNPEDKYNHMTVISKNQEGYENLCFLTSNSSDENHRYYKPRVGLNELFEHSRGLIATTGCFLGMVPQAIFRGTGKEEEILLKFKNVFKDDFFIEIHLADLSFNWDKTEKKHLPQYFSPMNEKHAGLVRFAKQFGVWDMSKENEPQVLNPQAIVNMRLMELGRKHDIKMYITQDAHMPDSLHYHIQKSVIFNSPSGKDGWHFKDAYYIKTIPEMLDDMIANAPYIPLEDFKELIENTQIVVEKTKDFELNFDIHFPEVDYAANEVNKNDVYENQLLTMESNYAGEKDFIKVLKFSRENVSLRTALKLMIKNGRIDFTDPVRRSRVASECIVIQMNGKIELMDYFHNLEKVTEEGNKIGRMKGPGRGSSAGSIVAYGLMITDVDPIVWGLLFERFLTIERVGRYNFSVPEFKK